MTQFAKAIGGIAASPGLIAGISVQLLSAHSQTTLPPVDRFSARAAFQEGTTIGGRTLFAIGWNFTDHFLSTVEIDVPGVTINGWRVLRNAGDETLIRALGDEERARVPYLSSIYALMNMGGECPCHVDWQSNFAYVRSPIDRRLWAVHWSVNYENEWTIGAAGVPHAYADWPTGALVFNCQPS